MTDIKVNDTRASAQPAGAIETPLSVFVKGGTTTDASDRQIQQDFAEAEKRRDEAAAEQRFMRAQGGQTFTHKLSDAPEVPQAYVKLDYLTRAGELYTTCLADLKVGEDAELILILVCPQCLQRKGHQDQAQIQVRQRNRNFQFVAAEGSPTFTFDDGNGPRIYHSAGVVRESERFSCPQCSWAARIERNRVRPD